MIFILFLIVWLIIAMIANNMVIKIFPFSRWEAYSYSLILVLVTWCLLASMLTSWFKYNFWLMWLMLFLIMIIFFWINKFLKEVSSKNKQDLATNFNDWPLIVWLVFYLLVGWGIMTTILSAQGNKIVSPWQLLPWWFILLVFMGLVFIFWSIVKQIKIKKVLCSIIALSFLIHSYLWVYQNGFGADRFRHLGSENRLLQNLEYQPTLLTKNLWLTTIGWLKIPQALIDRSKISYSFQWSIEVFLSQITGIEVFQINKFALPIIWSLAVPFLFYLIGWLIFSDKNKALIGAALSNGFYLLQYYGAQGLPAAYSVINVLVIIPFWLMFLKEKNNKTLLLAVIFTALSYFNYSLTLLTLLALSFLIILLKIRRPLAIFATLIITMMLFILELFDYNRFDFSISKLKDAWRAGNLLYFDSFSRWSVINIRLFEFLDFLFILFLIIIIVYIVIQSWKKNNEAHLVMSLMFCALTAAYFFSWTLLSGEHSLARRLTLFSVIFLVLMLIDLVYQALFIKQPLFTIGLLSLLFTINFYSGPVLLINISNRDLNKAQAIWQDISRFDNYPCIKDDLEVILSLEALSAKRFQESINSNNCHIINK